MARHRERSACELGTFSMWCENVPNRVSETFPMGNENVPVVRESVGHTWRPYTKKNRFFEKKSLHSVSDGDILDADRVATLCGGASGANIPETRMNGGIV